jgi:hypothetical protein
MWFINKINNTWKAKAPRIRKGKVTSKEKDNTRIHCEICLVNAFRGRRRATS